MRPFHFRLGSALLAALYLALPGGAFGVRACQHHDGVPTHAAAEASSEHAQHAGHHEAAAETEGTEPHGGCSCLDTCAAGTGLLLPSAPLAPLSTADRAVPAAFAACDDAPRAPRPDYFLPFPHGPPAIPG